MRVPCMSKLNGSAHRRTCIEIGNYANKIADEQGDAMIFLRVCPEKCKNFGVSPFHRANLSSLAIDGTFT